MIRGTTPTHIFNLSIETDTIKAVRITYEQFSKVVLEKTESDVTMEGKAIKLKLTQEETLRFRNGYAVSFQMKILTNDGVVMACPVKTISVEEILNEEVLT